MIHAQHRLEMAEIDLGEEKHSFYRDIGRLSSRVVREVVTARLIGSLRSESSCSGPH